MSDDNIFHLPGIGSQAPTESPVAEVKNFRTQTPEALPPDYFDSDFDQFRLGMDQVCDTLALEPGELPGYGRLTGEAVRPQSWDGIFFQVMVNEGYPISFVQSNPAKPQEYYQTDIDIYVAHDSFESVAAIYRRFQELGDGWLALMTEAKIRPVHLTRIKELDALGQRRLKTAHLTALLFSVLSRQKPTLSRQDRARYNRFREQGYQPISPAEIEAAVIDTVHELIWGTDEETAKPIDPDV